MNDNIESRVVRLEVLAEQTTKALDRIERELFGLRNDMHGEIAGVRGEMIGLRSEMATQFRWIVGILVTVLLATSAEFVTLANLIVHHG